MAPIKSNNPLASYFDFFSKSGTDASDPYVLSNVKATGGTAVEPGNGYVYHVFTAPDTIVATGADVNDVDWLVVAGGGAGGSYFGAGGGAGGYRVRSPNAGPRNSPTTITISSSPIPVSVGNGGATSNAQGADSVFGPITSTGGGGGATGGGGGTAGTTGGSGGGGGATNSVPVTPGWAGNTPPTSPPQGNDGGAGYYLGTYPAGGGGGAGGTGGDAGNNSSPGQPGGAGYPNPDFAAPHIAPALTDAGIPSSEITAFTTAVGPTGLYAGGGAGASPVGTQTGGSGGGGGPHIPGVNYTGGGAGGMNPPQGTDARVGGKGIVIIRYAV